MKREPKVMWNVRGPDGGDTIIEARTRGAAVRKYARARGMTLKTNCETGGWIGVSAEVMGAKP